MAEEKKTRATIALENRRLLANATADYFAQVDAAEDALGLYMAAASRSIDVDQEL